MDDNKHTTELQTAFISHLVVDKNVLWKI